MLAGMTAPAPSYQRFFAELKRRRVFRVMAVYGIVGFVLLQVVDLAVPALLLPEWTYRFVALIVLLGLPVAVVLAWAFEMTPEGVQRTSAAEPGEIRAIIAAPAWQRWPAGVLALTGLSALLLGAWYVGRESVSPAATATAAGAVEASIAVLPFLNMSSDPEQEYFSDGISEELLNLLAKIPELQVAARTSSFSFKGQNLEITEIAKRLNVAHVLEGSVRKSGNEVRVTAQLIRAADGFHLWSESWDRTLDDIFSIQDEIATDVAEQLTVTLLGSTPTAAEADPAAYALFLQARHMGHQRNAESLEQSRALYQQAVEIDPDYAAAWAGLGRTYFTLVMDGLRPVEEGHGMVVESANRALAIDPEHAEAHALLGRAAASGNDRAEALQHFQLALELEPANTDVISDAAVLVRDLGRLDEAIELLEYARARDPVNPTIHSVFGVAYLWADRLDDSMESYRTALSLSPGRIAAYYGIGMALLLQGQPEAALSTFAQEEGDEEYRVKGMALALRDLGREEEFQAAFAELRERWGDRWPSEVAHVYAWTGDADATFEWLEKAIAQNEDGLNQQFLQPHYRPVHDDPRWEAFRERTGTSAAQLAQIEFNVRLPR